MSSLRGRLLLFLIPVTALALAVTGAGIERAVRADLERAMEGRLLALATGTATALGYEIDGSVEFDLEEGGRPELERSAGELFYAVAREGGELLFSSGDAPSGLFSFRMGVTDRKTPGKGVQPEGIGTKPDVSVTYDAKTLADGADPCLDAALRVLREKLR